MAPPSPAKPQTLKAGPPAQAPASCSANLLRSHRREGDRVPTDAAPGWKPRLRVAGWGVRGKEHPLSGRRETRCRLQSPPPRPRGPRRWRCVGRDGGPETRRGRNAGDGNASVHMGSPRATTPLLPALLSPTPGPADCGGAVSQAQAVSVSEAHRPRRPAGGGACGAGPAGAGPAGRCAPPSCASAAGLWLGTSPSWRRRESADTAPPGRDAQHRAAPRGAADPEAHGRRTPRPERGRPTGTCGHGSEQ